MTAVWGLFGIEDPSELLSNQWPYRPYWDTVMVVFRYIVIFSMLELYPNIFYHNRTILKKVKAIKNF